MLNTVHDDELLGLAGQARQHLGEARDVAVGEPPHLGPRQPAAVDDARVVLGVGEDEVARPDQRGQRRDVGHVARAEDHRVGATDEPGDAPLELPVHVERAAEEPHAVGAAAVHVDRPLGGAHHGRVLEEAEVRVGAEVELAPSVDLDGRGVLPDDLVEVERE